MKPLVRALLPMALLLTAISAKATLADLDTASPATSPEVSFQLTPVPANQPVPSSSHIGNETARDLASIGAGLIPPALLATDDAFAIQALIDVEGTQQPALLFSDLAWKLADKFYCVSMESGLPYVDPAVWTDILSPGWRLAFTYHSLTSHEDQLFSLNLPRKSEFLSPSLLEAASISGNTIPKADQ